MKNMTILLCGIGLKIGIRKKVAIILTSNFLSSNFLYGFFQKLSWQRVENKKENGNFPSRLPNK